MFLSWVAPRSLTAKFEPPLHLTISVLGEAYRAWLCDPLQPRRDVDAIAHQVTVCLLDYVAEMDADAKDDASVLGHAGIALDHCVLHFNSAAHGLDDAAKLYDGAVAGPFDYPSMMHRNGGINQVAAQRSKPGEYAIFVRSRETAVSDHVRAKDGRKFPGLRHCAPLPRVSTSTKNRSERRLIDDPGEERRISLTGQ
jgi:hypothetical protein